MQGDVDVLSRGSYIKSTDAGQTPVTLPVPFEYRTFECERFCVCDSPESLSMRAPSSPPPMLETAKGPTTELRPNSETAL
jgi:hypothetical protein